MRESVCLSVWIGVHVQVGDQVELNVNVLLRSLLQASTATSLYCTILK